MTFFHEIGHSMNADHDDVAAFKDRQKECSPSVKEGGSYLMYPTGTEGVLPNNRAYSHCSLETISYVLASRKIFFFSKSMNRCAPVSLLENIWNSSVKRGENVCRRQRQWKANVMESFQPMKFVMNMGRLLLAARPVVNWSRVLFVRRWVSVRKKENEEEQKML